MKFRTEIDIKPWSEPIDYSHNIVCLGSCFATNIAEELSRRKFRVVASPTGILFNPASIAQSMRQMVAMQTPNADELMEVECRYVHYNFHSALGRDTREDTITTIGTALQRGKEALESADMVIVTLGTAGVYRLADGGAVVANCHKQPQRLFRRELLTVEECVAQLEEIVALAPRRVLFTVSPVRHVGEGLEENSLSKAILRVAVDIVCRRNAVRVAYFPSYEILIDDLRDYRFYSSDMLHPSDVAIDYIVNKFYDTALSNEAKSLKLKVDRIIQAAEHRPFDPHCDEYKSFCRKQLEAIKSIPDIDLSKESEYFEHMLQINL